MDPAKFWAWLLEQQNLRGIGHRCVNGEWRDGTLVDLSKAAGLEPRLLSNQRYNGTYPTERQARRIARALGIPFQELAKRAQLRDLRLEQQKEIQTCLGCHLGECVPMSINCLLRQQ